MKKIYKTIEKFSSVIYMGQKAVLLAIAVIMVAVTVADIFLRLFVSRGLAWAQELVIALFMALIFLGANIAIKTDGEIKIDLLHFKNPKAQLFLMTLVDCVCLFAIVLLLRSAIASVQNVMARPQYLATLPISYSVLYMVMPVGCSLMLLDKVVTILRRFFDKESLEKMREEAVEMENSDK